MLYQITESYGIGDKVLFVGGDYVVDDKAPAFSRPVPMPPPVDYFSDVARACEWWLERAADDSVVPGSKLWIDGPWKHRRGKPRIVFLGEFFRWLVRRVAELPDAPGLPFDVADASRVTGLTGQYRYVKILRQLSQPDKPEAVRRGRRKGDQRSGHDKVLAALAKYHGLEDDGSVGTKEPAGLGELSKLAGASRQTCSNFLASKLGRPGYKRYEAKCVKGVIGPLLLVWRGEVPKQMADLLTEEYGRRRDD